MARKWMLRARLLRRAAAAAVEQQDSLSVAGEDQDDDVSVPNGFEGNIDESVDSADDQLDLFAELDDGSFQDEALDPEPVQDRTLPPGVRMLQSGNARATIWFKKQSLFLGDYHIVEHAIEARAIADERRWEGPYMKKAVYLQKYVFDEVKRRGIPRIAA
jgi:hypothetical protein